MLSYKRQEERAIFGSDFAEKAFADFALFEALWDDEKLPVYFMKMQRIYIFDEKNILPCSRILDHMAALYDVLIRLDEGLGETKGQSMTLPW